MTDELLRKIEDALWPRGGRRDIWMILDGARDSRIFSMLLECRLEYLCLYSGSLTPELEMAAPYLVQLDYEHRDTRRFIRQAWGNSWGVFLRCDSHKDRLRRHLRTLLVARDTRGNRLVFRYYDPRVLRVYLPTCTPEEVSEVFGPIQCFWAEDQTSDRILEFAFDRVRLTPKTHSLESGSVMS
jgi:Domain of unknown function (DUF4123)